MQKQPPAAQRSPAAIAALADRLLTDVLPLGPCSQRALQILRDCGGDLEKAAPMLCAPAAGAVDKDAGATGERRGTDAGAAMPPAASSNKRSAQGDASTVDADCAPARTAKKARRPTRLVTPDAGLATVAGPGAPAEAPVSVVSPKASGELPAPRAEATSSVQLAPPPVEPLYARGDAAASTAHEAPARASPPEPATARLLCAASAGLPTPAAAATSSAGAPTQEECPSDVAARFPQPGAFVQCIWTDGYTLEAPPKDLDVCVIEIIGAPKRTKKRKRARDETEGWYAFASVPKTCLDVERTRRRPRE